MVEFRLLTLNATCNDNDDVQARINIIGQFNNMLCFFSLS